MDIYVFKKIVGGLMMPVAGLVVFAMVLLFFYRDGMKRWWQLSFAIFATVFIVTGYGWITDPLLHSLENRYAHLDVAAMDRETVRWIVVLGGGHGTGADAFSNVNEASLKRVLEGVRLNRACQQARLMLSGGGNGQTDAGSMHAAIVAAGIDPLRVMIEDSTLDTDDQARIIGRIVGQDRCVLVTSAFHMRRAVLLFEARGVTVVPAPTDYRVVQKDWLSRFLPSAGGFRNAEILLHEYLGILWACMRGQI